MLEISPLTQTYPVIKPRKIKKEDSFSEQPQSKKKPVVDDQEPQPVQHIDEIA